MALGYKSQLYLQEFKGGGGNFVDSDALAASYDSDRPHVFEGVLDRIYTSEVRFSSKPLTNMLKTAGNVMEIDTDYYRWYLQGAEYQTFRSMENLEASNATPGINQTEFRLKLDVDYLVPSDVLQGENNEYALRVQSYPEQDGNGYIYMVKLVTDNPLEYFPNDLLDEGREFLKNWTVVANEMNTEYGSGQWGQYFQLESQIGFFAEEFKMTDKAMRNADRLAIKLVHKDKSLTNFMVMGEADMNERYYMGIEAALTYGKKSNSLSKEGYQIKTGPGLRQMLKDGNVEYFNSSLTEQRLKDFLLNIFFARNNESQRKITLMTGTYGAIMFHEMLANSASGFLTVDTHFIRNSPDKVANHLSYGAQFTHYYGPEGIEVDLIKNPLYDDLRYQRRTHPQYPNIPIDSWRMTVLDFSPNGNSKSNIMMLKEKDTFNYGYVPGRVGPSGKPIQGGQAISKEGACNWFIQGSAGLWIKDVSRTGELIFDYDG